MPSASSQAELSWTIETAVAGINENDSLASLALTSEGNPRIAYFDERSDLNDTEVRFAERIGGTWSNEFVANRGQFNKLGISLKLTDTDAPRIGFFNFFGGGSFGDAQFASRTSGVWSVTDIATSGFEGEYIHLVLDSNNSPSVAFVDSTSSQLRFSAFDGSTWVTTDVADRGVPAFLRLNNAGEPLLAFVDDSDGALKVGSDASGSWTFDTAIAVFGGSSRSISMAVNNDTLFISFVDSEGLKLASNSGGTWAVETAVASTTLSNLTTSIALDAFGDPYIAYQTATEVVVAHLDEGVWTSSTVANGTLNLSLGEALAIQGDTLGLVYTTVGNADLNYAWTTIPIPEPQAIVMLAAGIILLGLRAFRRKTADC